MYMVTEVLTVASVSRPVGTSDVAKWASATLPLRRFTVDEYYRMAKAGILGEDERIELINGVIVTMAAQGGPHVTAVTKIGNAFRETVNEVAVVREEKPIDLGDSE